MSEMLQQNHMENKQRNTDNIQVEGHLLCLNAGSSSLKFKLFDRSNNLQGHTVALEGTIKIKEDDQGKKYRVIILGDDDSTDLSSPDLLSLLLDKIFKSIKDLKITHIAHRIVHGANMPQCISISPSDQHHLGTLQFLSSFAPLHNAVSVNMIRHCLESDKLGVDVENLCCFDTSFHHSLEEKTWRYMVDETLTGKSLPGGMQLRKWGFHGLSYSSILHTLSQRLRKPIKEMNVIICHLGSGSSICAIAKGRSVDTTMGLTPLEGLPGSTRSGSVDPVLALHISSSRLEKGSDPFGLVDLGGGIKVSQAELVLNKQSGFKAVAGTADFEAICKRRNTQAKLAFDIFIDRIAGYIGSYYFKLSSYEGVEAVVFSGGVGEASKVLHQALADKLQRTPLRIGSVNLLPEGGGDEVVQISAKDLGQSRDEKFEGVPWLICKTDEETEMARVVNEYLGW